MSDKEIVTGGCLCRQVRYEATGAPVMRVICHCDNCRKVTGSICMANSFYLKSQFRILAGEDVIKTYDDNNTDSGNVLNRSFCSNCGSCLFTTSTVDGVTADAVVLTSGTMDFGGGKEDWVPQREFYCKDRATWLPPLENTIQSSGM
ncbi:hypothetical protein N7466_002401 [Penicillium verhagenii]|uniref:uncharacterized protein n=1 Tax=Penicillium verhagenii TaxID=1562060 RepID=UPI002545732D|nr:uncharacterized protein N7466_002401 [Penicillium verhagenii]KAJ5939267.1 hypothetical protein N7466_002401 [Penicillium verhagenii]